MAETHIANPTRPRRVGRTAVMTLGLAVAGAALASAPDSAQAQVLAPIAVSLDPSLTHPNKGNGPGGYARWQIHVWKPEKAKWKRLGGRHGQSIGFGSSATPKVIQFQDRVRFRVAKFRRRKRIGPWTYYEFTPRGKERLTVTPAGNRFSIRQDLVP